MFLKTPISAIFALFAAISLSACGSGATKPRNRTAPVQPRAATPEPAPTVPAAPVRRDDSMLAIRIEHPANRAVVDTSPVEVVGHVQPADGVRLSIAGRPIEVEGGAFRAPVPLIEGENSIEIVADRGG